MGMFLAKAHPVEADVVVGVPDSGLDAALGYAEASGIPYGIGLLKNKYIGRTFIAPGQKMPRFFHPFRGIHQTLPGRIFADFQQDRFNFVLHRILHNVYTL